MRVFRVNPGGTSSKCPRCSSRLVDSGFRTLRCRNCGFIGDRDVIATVNLYRRFLSKHPRCGEPGVSPNAPKPDGNPSGMRGNRDEAMTSTSINLHES